MPGTFDELADRFDAQALGCAQLGSAVYARLARDLAKHLRAGGPLGELVAEHAGLRFGEAVPLRFLGGVHLLALTGHIPEVAAYYPSCGGESPVDSHLAEAVVAAALEHRDTMADALGRGVQTNEVGRSAALICGVTEVVRRFGMPVQLVEIGPSAGLNLRMDQFGYDVGGVRYGPADAQVVFEGRWQGDVRPDLGPQVEVAERIGLDPAPIDPTTESGANRLLSFVWPDQSERFDRLRAAIATARQFPARLVRTDSTPASLAEVLVGLTDTRAPLATVVYHSIVWQYVDRDQRWALTAVLEEAGRTASMGRPLAWLRMEPDEWDRRRARLDLRTWPNGGDEALGTCGFHGEWVRLQPRPFIG